MLARDADQDVLPPEQVRVEQCRACLLLALRRCRCPSSTLSASSVLVAGLQGDHCEQACLIEGAGNRYIGPAHHVQCLASLLQP